MICLSSFELYSRWVPLFFEYIKRQPLMYAKFPHNRPFHGVFQLLKWTSSGKSVHTNEKSALKLVKVPSLKVIC